MKGNIMKVFCKDCQFHVQDGDTNIWSHICQTPVLPHTKINYITGDIDKLDQYCVSYNDTGDCSMYKKINKNMKDQQPYPVGTVTSVSDSSRFKVMIIQCFEVASDQSETNNKSKDD